MTKISWLALALLIFALAAWASTSSPLIPDAPMALSGKPGHFDFMEVDLKNERLLAAHKGAGTLTLVDLKSGALLPEIAVGHVQGVAIDEHAGTYILGADDEHQVVFVNSKTLKKAGEVQVDGPVDAIALDPKNGMVYADEDDGSHVWVIDIKRKKRVATISIPGVPEVVAYDPSTDRIYQNIKTKDSLVVINPKTNQVEAEWSTLPATGPHGLVIDSSGGRVFVAGHNGKLVAIDLKSGKVLAQADIAPGTDQISLDRAAKIIYCASKGFISAVQVSGSGLAVLGAVHDHAGAHTIAVDSRRHQAWISYADGKHSYLQRFKAAGL